MRKWCLILIKSHGFFVRKQVLDSAAFIPYYIYILEATVLNRPRCGQVRC